MKLAVLGTDDDVLALLEAATTAGHSMVWLGDVRPAGAGRLSQLLPRLKASEDWELLLDHALADAVLVGQGTASAELRAEQLKRLVTDAMPLLVVHPVATSVLIYYELDMARRESHGVLQHYTPLVGCPAIPKLAHWVKGGSGEIGTVHQVICQRFTADVEHESVIRHLARDVELLRAVAGEIRTVSAAGPRAADASLASLQVQMTGAGAATLRWAIAPASDGVTRAGLTIIGERGIVRLRLPPNDRSAAGAREDDDEEIEIGDRRESRPLESWDAPRFAIERLAAALPANGTEQSAAVSTWNEATAAMEVVDAIELSLQKGRTIEVYHQQLTEQLAFRGTMAAFGCGLLVLIFLVMVIVSLVGGVESFLGKPLVSAWPLIMLAVLSFFLLLQVVPWLAKRRRKTASEEVPNEL